MVAAEEPGQLQFAVKTPGGDVEVLLPGIRTELLSTTTIASRARLDVADSPVAQSLAPTPQTGRPVYNMPNHVIKEDGFLIVRHKSDAADTLDSDDALAKVNLSVVQRDLNSVGTGREFRIRQLNVADRNTTEVTDDPVLSTSAFVNIYAFKCPTGLEWKMHGDHEVFVADDTA